MVKERCVWLDYLTIATPPLGGYKPGTKYGPYYDALVAPDDARPIRCNLSRFSKSMEHFPSLSPHRRIMRRRMR